MRVFAASLATETNTFAPLPVDRRAFEQAFYAPPGQHPATPTLCSAPITSARKRVRDAGLTLIEGTATWAEPAGMVGRAAYEGLRDEILGQLEAALPVDIVLLGLHGSMVAHDYDDCEGDLIQHVRRIAGPGAVIGVELDMHCHLTDAMVSGATVINAFKEFPHTDFSERADDLVELCLRTARGRVRPVMSVFDCRIITGFMTSREPGRSFVDRIKALEGTKGILSISIIHGFTAADVRDMGMKVLVITDNRPAEGAALAERLGRDILSWAAAATPKHYKPGEALALVRRRMATDAPGKPLIFADRWDNPGGGVGGDSTFMITEILLNPSVRAAVGVMWDPVAVQFCLAAGAGVRLQLRIGGKVAASSGDPVDALVTIRAVTDDLRIPFQDSVVSLGAAACVSFANLDVVLATGRAQTFSPPAFTLLGVDLAAMDMVVVKSSNHFHAAFAPVAREIFYLDCGGPFPADPLKIAFT